MRALWQISNAMLLAPGVRLRNETSSVSPSVSSSTCSINLVNASRSNSCAAPALSSSSVLAIPLTLPAVADGLGVVAVGSTHERTEVAGVIFRPQPRLVQRLGAQFHRRPVKGAHRVFVGRLERDVHLPTGSGAISIRDPERRLTVPSVSDGAPDIHLPRVTQHAKHGVVKLLRFGVISTGDAQVIDHEKILA